MEKTQNVGRTYRKIQKGTDEKLSKYLDYIWRRTIKQWVPINEVFRVASIRKPGEIVDLTYEFNIDNCYNFPRLHDVGLLIKNEKGTMITWYNHEFPQPSDNEKLYNSVCEYRISRDEIKKTTPTVNVTQNDVPTVNVIQNEIPQINVSTIIPPHSNDNFNNLSLDEKLNSIYKGISFIADYIKSDPYEPIPNNQNKK